MIANDMLKHLHEPAEINQKKNKPFHESLNKNVLGKLWNFLINQNTTVVVSKDNENIQGN